MDKQKKKELLKTKINWQSTDNYEMQTLRLIAKFHNIDESMTDHEILQNLLEMLTISIQRNLSLSDYFRFKTNPQDKFNSDFRNKPQDNNMSDRNTSMRENYVNFAQKKS